ncbi:MAG: phosphate ABC transporter permease subunit PstC [Neomegalonema sp.]|nr:phosphate ABC transporter permease subunit PstC [Neomegalonema sp.]
MGVGLALGAILLIAVCAFLFARSRAIASSDGLLKNLHSRPSYHGLYSFLWTGLIGLLALIILSVGVTQYTGSALEGVVAERLPDASAIQRQSIIRDAKAQIDGGITSRSGDVRDAVAETYASLKPLTSYAVPGIAIALAALTALMTNFQVGRDFRARNRSERVIRGVLMVCASVAIVTTIGIVLSLVFETIVFFDMIHWDIGSFLFGTTWSPLSGVHSGTLDPAKIGWIPLLVGTLMITLIAMLVAVPIGLMSAIYLSDYASPRLRAWAKPMLEILAGIPTVVYGFFAAITVAPFIRNTGEAMGLTVASESALAAGIVMGIMIIPFVSSLSDDVINAVPQSLRDGSYGLGATKAETIRKVILPAALPGIISAVILGFSRAVGETMIVVMAAGQGANLTWNPLEAVTTVTVQIVALILGDTDAGTAGPPAFTLGFALFTVTLILNIIALRIVRRYREMYD